MRTIRRAFRTLLRSPLRTGLLIAVLAVSVGLTLIMITVNGAFVRRHTHVGSGDPFQTVNRAIGRFTYLPFEMVTLTARAQADFVESALGVEREFFTAGGTVTVEMRTHTEAEGSDVSAEAYIATAQVVSERYIQLRVSVTGTTPIVSQMTTLLDGETLVDDFEDIAVASESATWFERV